MLQCTISNQPANKNKWAYHLTNLSRHKEVRNSLELLHYSMCFAKTHAYNKPVDYKQNPICIHSVLVLSL